MEPIFGSGIKAQGPTIEVHEWAHGQMGGPPLHVHHKDDEAWHVLDGELHFRFTDSTRVAKAGETVFVPAGVPHTFGSPDDVRYLIITTPKVRELIDALHAPDKGNEAEIYKRYDSELLE